MCKYQILSYLPNFHSLKYGIKYFSKYLPDLHWLNSCASSNCLVIGHFSRENIIEEQKVIGWKEESQDLLFFFTMNYRNRKYFLFAFFAFAFSLLFLSSPDLHWQQKVVVEYMQEKVLRSRKKNNLVKKNITEFLEKFYIYKSRKFGFKWISIFSQGY